MTSIYDVCVIGGGPAGLASALALGRVVRRVVVFELPTYRNQTSLHANNIPGLDYEHPTTIRQRSKEELAKYQSVVFAGAPAKEIFEGNDGFCIIDGNSKTWNGRKLILATGVTDLLPSIPGFAEAWGKGIFHCLYCKGFEEVGVPNAAFLIVNGTEHEIQSTLWYGQLAHQFTRDFTILLNGHGDSGASASLEAARKHGMKFDTRRVQKIQYLGERAATKVIFADGTEETYGFIFHKPMTKLVGDFAQRLELETNSDGSIKTVSPLQETSHRGVFACGDCASPMKQVVVAIADGAKAGFGANQQIMAEDYSRNFW